MENLGPFAREIKLGNTVKDATSGFQGIAIQILERMNGNIQWAIQPQLEPGGKSYPDAMFIDEHMIDYVDDGVMARVTPVTSKTEIVLGQRVRDIATDFEGIAIAKAIYLNGCVRFAVVPKAVKTHLLNDNSSENWISDTQLEIVDEGILQKAEKAVVATNGKVPGGPAMRVANR